MNAKPSFTAFDRDAMRAALALAARGLGQVAPNPAVGCVLVNQGHIVGRGWTQPGGRPHAETEALRRAGEAARGAFAYVTLEPCAHHGKTPPCAKALIDAGVARVVAATIDPDPRVAGQGLALLQAAGIATEVGLMEAEARRLNAGFFSRIEKARPLMTLKLAMSLDGRIATHSGESKWITSEAARAEAHLLRAQHDAVMVGSSTALADDPKLNVRLAGLEGRSPIRIVVDGRLRLPLTHELVAGAMRQPTWLVTRADGDPDRRRAYAEAGVEVLALPTHPGEMLDLSGLARALGQRGITRVLVEGGGHLAAALLAADLIDRLEIFHAPLILGGDGLAGVAALGLEKLAAAPRFRLVSQSQVGQDLLESYEKAV